VTAALEAGTPPGKLPVLLAWLRPAIEQSATEPGDRVNNVVRDNVVLVVRQLLASKPILSELAEAGHLRIVGAVYALDSGKVEWLPPVHAREYGAAFVERRVANRIFLNG